MNTKRIYTESSDDESWDSSDLEEMDRKNQALADIYLDSFRRGRGMTM